MADGESTFTVYAKIEGLWQGAYGSGMDIMADAGVDNEDALEAFLAENPQHAADMQQAARDFFVNHNSDGLKEMAQTYLPQMDRYEADRVKELLTDAGYSFSDRPEGGLFVNVNGTPVSWEVAVKQQIISFS
ncbi:hypothetical protein SAMN05444003_0770 [Cognatiyoonia sediminum]|uniref:Uncharacterized protein n=1 Tax=Cognatiyoonia sediminum TaxID=1508389 RepID=A0A1M5MDC6_9RHOB|nr:hypothetical protein [Cognatiyoonia sediminum]SHG75226.1 hypothetical protein SAMN05444003_0770 [Cognatiyoonia sediminum]